MIESCDGQVTFQDCYWKSQLSNCSVQFTYEYLCVPYNLCLDVHTPRQLQLITYVPTMHVWA